MSIEKYSLMMVMTIVIACMISSTAKSISKITDLTAVTSFLGIDAYYRTMKLQSEFDRQIFSRLIL